MQLRTGEDRPERWYATADTADLAAATDGVILSTNGMSRSAGRQPPLTSAALAARRTRMMSRCRIPRVIDPTLERLSQARRAIRTLVSPRYDLRSTRSDSAPRRAADEYRPPPLDRRSRAGWSHNAQESRTARPANAVSGRT